MAVVVMVGRRADAVPPQSRMCCESSRAKVRRRWYHRRSLQQKESEGKQPKSEQMSIRTELGKQ